MSESGRREVLIAGGGVAALEAALALRSFAPNLVGVELLAPEPRFSYRPLSVAEPFELGEVRHFELAALARSLGARFTQGALVSVDESGRLARTSTGREIPFDSLLIACGAIPSPAIPGAVTFRGPTDTEAFRGLLAELAGGEIDSLAFAVPWGATWSLPVYELALLTASYLDARELGRIEMTIVTPEEEPLGLFGRPAVDALRALLDERGVSLLAGVYPSEVVGDELRLIPEGSVRARRVVALPRLLGPRIDGVPQTAHGFIPVDSQCRVIGMTDVLAAGDITNFSVKQGGIATQQADVAAETIAAAAGSETVPGPFRPVLRGLLLTGGEPRYMRHELDPLAEEEPVVSTEALWWPPAKIVGRFLAPHLASLSGVEGAPDLLGVAQETVTVEVELDPDAVGGTRSTLLRLDRLRAATEGAQVTVAGSLEPLIVAPEDTLGDVAEKMLASTQTCLAVCDHDRLVGILTTTDFIRACAMRVQSGETHVREWMTAEPFTVPVGTPLEEAELLMREYGVHHLLVVENDKPVGALHDLSALVGNPAVHELTGTGRDERPTG
jgi:sulfide:quinone oxidoreductase